jgi:hypothetical protein
VQFLFVPHCVLVRIQLFLSFISATGICAVYYSLITLLFPCLDGLIQMCIKRFTFPFHFRMRVRYSTAADRYYRGLEDDVTPGNNDLRGWRNGVHSVTSVLRKEELDWKMVRC